MSTSKNCLSLIIKIDLLLWYPDYTLLGGRFLFVLCKWEIKAWI